jgi:hypothetical protein
LGSGWPGAGLLAVTGAIHLDLYLTGYQSIPVIGWLFLLQVIAAFGLAAAVLVSGSRLAAMAGAGFALSTLGGYLLSVWIGGPVASCSGVLARLQAGVPGAELQRDVRWLLAARDRDPGRRPGRDWQAEHDQAVRRHDAGRLQRASPVHLRR